MPRRDGAFLVEDFYFNAGGLNTADSPFAVNPDECVGGKNFDYLKRGGIQKRKGHAKLNSSADTELRTLGLGIWDKPGENREVIRAAGRKFQNFHRTAYTFTNLTEDTAAAGSDFLAADSTIPVSYQMYNSATAGVLWSVGGGMDGIYGAYSETKVTKNGVAVPTGTTSASVTSSSGGSWTASGGTGAYRYAFALYKASTGATSNASVECTVSVATLTDTVTIVLSSLAAIDTTKYTKLYIYRSSVGGSESFTAGKLVKMLDISGGVPSSTTDTGSNVNTSIVVPRAGSGSGDHSELPAGTYKGIALFKRRLVVAKGSTLYIADVNNPEYFATYQTITVPSGGEITGLGVISRAFAGSDEIDEILCVFKQSELWVLTGTGTIDANSLPDWSLKFIDNSGCASQPLIVSAEGKLAWVNYRGVFLWDGGAKPKYLSQPIEDKFQRSGDIDKSKLGLGFGLFVQSRNEIQWYVSSSDEGEQKYGLKLDLRLTGQQGSSSDALGEVMTKGIFTPDVPNFPIYAGVTYLYSGDATEETTVLGDNAGFLYSGYLQPAESGGNMDFEYITPYLSLGNPTSPKRVSKVIAWVLDAGPYNLTLDFWSNYRYKEADKSSVSQAISPSLIAGGTRWGAFTWGSSVWGANADKVTAVVFNLNGVKNNLEGDAFRLKFSHSGTTEVVLIYGFSIVYNELPMRK